MQIGSITVSQWLFFTSQHTAFLMCSDSRWQHSLQRRRLTFRIFGFSISHSVFMVFIQLLQPCLTSRRSQPPLALAVPLSRFTPQVGGGSAFYVRLLLHLAAYPSESTLHVAYAS
jgi:hypothetical protein